MDEATLQQEYQDYLEYQEYQSTQRPRLADVSSSVIDSVKQFGSGVIEGTAGLAAMASDFAVPRNGIPIAPGFSVPRPDFSSVGNFFASQMPRSLETQEALSQVLPAKPEDGSYSRTIGQFVGPGGLLGGVGKALNVAGKAPQTANLLSKTLNPRIILGDVTGGAGAEAAEQVTGNKTIAPLLGGLIGSAAPSVFSNASSLARSTVSGATPAEIKGSAALAMRNITGLDSDEILSRLANASDDELRQFLTTAELTDNAGMAQLEKVLSASDEPARQYSKRAVEREATRQRLLNRLSEVSGVNSEGLGSQLIERANAIRGQMDESAKNIWELLPRNIDVDVTREQASLQALLDSSRGGLGLKRDSRALVGQFLDDSGSLTSGELQNIRADALKLLRDSPRLSSLESRALASLQDLTDKAMERGLTGQDYDIWQEARNATARRASTFNRQTAGGSLTREGARPAKALGSAFKGDTRSARELKSAIGDDPELLEAVKRGVLDFIPTDSQGNLTAHKMKSFLNANEGALRELYGEDGLEIMQKIFADLQSEANVGANAFKASKANSVTQQRGTVAGAINDVITGAVVPGNGPIARVVKGIQESANVRDTDAVKDLLFRAAMEPEFAAELAQTPTNKRVLNVLQRLQKATREAGVAGARGVTLDLARPSSLRTDPTSSRVGGLNGQPLAVSSSPEAPQIRQDPPLASPAPSAVQRSGLLSKGPELPSRPMPKQELNQSIPSSNIAPISERIQGLMEPQQFSLLSRAVEAVESGGRADAVSSAGAIGTHQVMPIAMREVMRAQGIDDSKYTNAQLKEIAKRPGMSQAYGEEYLLLLIKKFQDPELALAAYNGGETRVRRLLKETGGNTFADIASRLPSETRQYVPKVRSALQRLQRRNSI